MSFSKSVKEELNSIQIKSNCCKKAYLFGAMMSASYHDNEITVQLSDSESTDKIVFILNSIYKCDVDSKKTKRGCFEINTLNLSSKKIYEFLIFADQYSSCNNMDSIIKCQGCRSAFLRGVFCACGSVSDPLKCYSLELRIPNRNRAELLKSVINEWGIKCPSQTKRGDMIGLYYRNESSIEDFITACGGNKSLFSFYDALVEKNVRNEENRATNCVARNIAKTVTASAHQVSAIESLISAKVLSDMSKEIQITAHLRLEYPDVSISELADLHDPPISKSGLNHRLAKILDEAQKRKLI